MAAPCIAGDSPAELRRIDAGEPSCDSLKPKARNRAVTVREQARVKAYFDHVLFDGPTARWKFEAVKGGIVCGSVNAKNRMGAYTGWTPFSFILDEAIGTIYSEDDRVWLFAAVCKG